MNFDDALQYIQSLGHETLSIKLGLTSTERLFNALTSPHQSFPSVQIAGTNGKGSTAAMLDAICRAAGIKAGLYTSPHLVSFTERFRIGGCEISPVDFAQAVSTVRDAALAIENVYSEMPTIFEQLTAVALVAFRNARIELGILETGLGGRLDSTTAARAKVVAITPIALDHQEFLGNTLAEIAAEKAAIIRPNVRTIIAPQTPEAMNVILDQCRKSGVTARFATRNIEVAGSDNEGRLIVNFVTEQGAYPRVRLSLRGRHQIVNASVAIALAESLREQGLSISGEAIIKGLETARHAGRLQLLAGTPPILLDGAHNVAGALALRDYLDEFIKAPVTLLFGAMRDKDISHMAAKLFPIAQRIILVQLNNPRAADRETLKSIVPSAIESSRIAFASNTNEALKLAREKCEPDGIICATGSLYLVGEILKTVVSNA